MGKQASKLDSAALDRVKAKLLELKPVRPVSPALEALEAARDAVLNARANMATAKQIADAFAAEGLSISAQTVGRFLKAALAKAGTPSKRKRKSKG
jgi:hypothetical protein